MCAGSWGATLRKSGRGRSSSCGRFTPSVFGSSVAKDVGAAPSGVLVTIWSCDRWAASVQSDVNAGQDPRLSDGEDADLPIESASRIRRVGTDNPR